jgi:DNA-binding response OmpR family regulator
MTPIWRPPRRPGASRTPPSREFPLSPRGTPVAFNPRVVPEILVIDDDPAGLESYGRLLARLGHPVRLLEGAEAARDDPALLRGVAVLILDQRMPRLSGLDLVALVHARPAADGPRPAILLVTAVPTEELRARAAGLGVAEVIEKPVSPAHLLARVRAALAARP